MKRTLARIALALIAAGTLYGTWALKVDTTGSWPIRDPERVLIVIGWALACVLAGILVLAVLYVLVKAAFGEED
ncbi:MAG TPA: hypothetical protein VF192_01455 [Longimicrobiales bacterium]